MKNTILAAGFYSLLACQPASAMTLMSEEELAVIDGQSLFNLSYLAPNDTGNFESANNVGFYKLDVEIGRAHV